MRTLPVCHEMHWMCLHISINAEKGKCCLLGILGLAYMLTYMYYCMYKRTFIHV